MSGDSGRAAPNGQRLLEHVLEGQRAIQGSVTALQVQVAGYYGEATKSNALLAQRVDRLDKSHDSSNERLAALERKLVVISTAYAAALMALAVIWAVYGDSIKKAVTSDASDHGAPAAAHSKG